MIEGHTVTSGHDMVKVKDQEGGAVAEGYADV